MPKSLTLDQQVWVDNTLAGLSLEACVGQLLLPDARDGVAGDWAALVSEIPLGGLFVDERDPHRLGLLLDAVQSHSRVPLVAAAAMENGVAGGTEFPDALAFGAAGDRALVLARSRVVAREARALGVHWVFQPSADILYQFRNPELGARAFGDKPARVRALTVAQVTGLQEDGLLAATARVFPGGGADDRDSRLCTVLNPLAMGRWRRTYGSVWRAAIDAGVMAVMTGNIALPDGEGLGERPAEALPGALSRRVQVDLLRTELGFRGVIVSSAAEALASRIGADAVAARFLAAGGDVLVTADPRRDFAQLLRAIREGQLDAARIRESARRVLELKVRVGLHRALKAAGPTAEEQAAAQAGARGVAERAITVWKNDGTLPLRLPAGARILTVTVGDEPAPGEAGEELDVVDDELRRRGYAVDHGRNMDAAALAGAAACHDLVCVNVVRAPSRSERAGGAGTDGWRGFATHRANVVFTVFGSPFVVYEAPQWPNAVLAYGTCAACQGAAVRAWLGELEPRGVLPVTMPRF